MEKRREARRAHRERKRKARKGMVANEQERGEIKRASAQAPKIWVSEKGIWIATLNVDGLMSQGKREEVEKRMKKHNIAFLFLQETHTAVDSREQGAATHGTSAGRRRS